MRRGTALSTLLTEVPFSESWNEVKQASDRMEEAQKKSNTNGSQNSSEETQKNVKAEPSHSIALGFMSMGSNADGDANDDIMIVRQKTEAEVKRETCIKNMSFDEEQVIENYEKKSSERVARFVEIIVMKPDVKDLAADFRNTQFGKLRGGEFNEGESDCVIIYYRPQGASEYQTQTQWRVPTLRRDGPCGGHFKCSIQAVLQSRLPANDEHCGKYIHEGDCFVVSDGTKESNKALLMNAFTDPENKSIATHQKKLTMFVEEDHATRHREGYTRSGLTVDQTENFFFITAGTLKAPKRARLNFPNTTTAGTILGPVALPDDDDDALWKMPISGKKKLYGPARVLPGGPVDKGTQADGAVKPKPRTDTTVEPVTFFGLKADTYKELLHQAGNIKNPRSIKAVIDLTPIDGVMGAICLEHGIPYLAVALTEFHREKLMRRLVLTTFNTYATPNTELYAPMLHKVLMPKEKDDPKKPGPGPVTVKPPKKKEDEEAEQQKNPDTVTPSPAPKKEASSAKKKGTDDSVKASRDRLLARLGAAAAAGNNDDDKGATDDGVGGNDE